MTVPPFNVILRRSTPEIVLSLKNIFSKFCKQDGKLVYSRYCQVSLLALCYHSQTLSKLFLKYGVRRESEDERLTKLDNRIEWAKARHELTHLVNGNLLLVDI